MSLRAVTVEETLRRWKSNPQELLAWITELIWKAEIKPDDSLSWIGKDGKITIMTSRRMIEEAKKEFTFKREGGLNNGKQKLEKSRI